MKKCFFLFLLLSPLFLSAQERGDRAYITNPGSMYTTYKFDPADEDKIIGIVGADEFNRIDATCRESSWPSGISNLTAFFDNEQAIKNYTVYFVCRFADNKVLLRVPEGENRSMPSQLRPSETIHFVIGGDAVSFSGSASSTSSSSGSYSRSSGGKVTITNFGDLYSTYSYSSADEDDIRDQVGSSMLSEIKTDAHEDSWPNDISGFDDRQTNRPKMYNYNVELVCTLGSDKVVLRAPVGQNSHMTGGMRLKHDIYFIIGKSGVDLSGSSSSTGSGGLYKGAGVTVTNFGDLYSTYSFESSDESAIRDAVGSSMVSEIKKYANEENWPSAISGFSDRQTNRPKMYNYNCEFVCSFGDKSVIKAPVSKNSHMSGGMRLSHDIYFVINTSSIEAK
jgi:hypothetical protein